MKRIADRDAGGSHSNRGCLPVDVEYSCGVFELRSEAPDNYTTVGHYHNDLLHSVKNDWAFNKKLTLHRRDLLIPSETISGANLYDSSLCSPSVVANHRRLCAFRAEQNVCYLVDCGLGEFEVVSEVIAGVLLPMLSFRGDPIGDAARDFRRIESLKHKIEQDGIQESPPIATNHFRERK